MDPQPAIVYASSSSVYGLNTKVRKGALPTGPCTTPKAHCSLSRCGTWPPGMQLKALDPCGNLGSPLCDALQVPFSEDDRTDRPASLYAATKKADEVLGTHTTTSTASQ